MSENALIVPGEIQQGGVIRLADKLDNIVAGFKEYTQACEQLLTNDDYQKIAGKTFKKKSAWRKIATAFGISTKIVSKEVSYGDDGRIHHAEFVVRAEAPNGRQSEAWAGASCTDRKFSHDQDIAATAQTRATNRAIADLIGCGEVSADEAATGDESKANNGASTEREFLAASNSAVVNWKTRLARPELTRDEFFGIGKEIKAEWANLTEEHATEIAALFASMKPKFQSKPEPATVPAEPDIPY